MDEDGFEPPGESTPSQPVSETGVKTPWPLREGDWFSVPDSTPHAHSGDTAEDIYSILAIQDQVGAEMTGLYDELTASAVKQWREFNGMEVDEDVERIVDQEAWELMMVRERDTDRTVGDQ